MDRRLLKYYDRELRHLQGMAKEFAREFPKVAGRLSIDDFPCADPYVERLLEGFAFLAARVQLKLESEFPRFTQNLLETVYPHYLAPTPSMAVVEITPDHAEGGLSKGFTLPRGTILRSVIGPGERTSCEYRTGNPLTLWPTKLAEARYYTRDVGLLGLAGAMEEANPDARAMGTLTPAKSALRLRIKATAGVTFDKMDLDDLTIYLRGADATPMRLYEQIIAHGRAVVVRPVKGEGAGEEPPTYVLAPSSIRRLGFEPGEALLPYDARSCQGYRLVHEYFAFPRRFAFVKLAGIGELLRRCKGDTADVVILMDQEDPDLEGAVDTDNVALHCVSVVNLFPKRADRILISDRFSEFHLLPDRTRPLDFEVYKVASVTGYAGGSEEVRKFKPFYSARDADGDSSSYFAVNRVPRVLSEREKREGRRSSYGGSEVYVSLVEGENSPFSTDIKQLGVEVLCTNRDLPLGIAMGRGKTDFTLDIGAPVSGIRVVAGPTPPRPSHVEPKGGQNEGDAVWRLISHLSLNYLSLMDDSVRDGEPAQGASALRDMLRLYADTSDPAVRQQVEGVRNVECRPIARRVPSPGPIAFARGLEVTVTLDETLFEGTGVFALGGVLERFFAGYVSINSFTETVIRTSERGEIMRWPAMIGGRPVL